MKMAKKKRLYRMWKMSDLPAVNMIIFTMRDFSIFLLLME